MKKIFTILSAAFFSVASIFAQDISYNWALAGGGANADRAASITSDATGNVYATGVFQETATFGNVTLTGAAKGSGANFDNNLFLTKMENGNNTIVWSIYSNQGAVNPTSVTTTSDGNIILTGNMRAVKGGATTNANIIDTEGTETTFEGLADAATGIVGFVAKFDANGKKIWINSISSSTGKNDVSDVATDADGNVYIVGYFDKDVTLPAGDLLTATSTQSSYIAKLDGNSGNQVWVKTTSGGIKKEDFCCITADESGIYVAGTFTNQTAPVEITFGGVTLEPSAYPDPVIAKLDKEGNFAYVQIRKHTLTTSSNTMLKDLVIKDSNLYLSGNFKGELSFSGGNIVSSTNLNGFISAFDATTGADIWQNTASCLALTETSAITVGSDKIFTYGYFYNKTGANAGPVDFGGDITLTTGDLNTKGDLFFAVYALDGAILKAGSIAQGDGSDVSIAITAVENDIYLFGHFNSVDANGANPLSFYGTSETLSTQGGFDFFVAKYTISDFVNSIQNNVNQDEDNLNIYFEDATIHINGVVATSVEIFNISGHITAKAAYPQGEENPELSFAGLNKGVYVVKIKTLSGNTKAAKIIF